MRKLIVTNIMSLDGYYEGPGCDVMALPMDPSFEAHNAERLRAADTVLLGRRTYELFKGFWPQVADSATATPDQRAISRMINAIEKVVVSDSLTSADTDPWRGTTRIVKRAEAQAAIAAYRRQPGKEILTFGSRTLWHGLWGTGLIDELHLVLGAAVLGAGTPIFDTVRRTGLRLLGTRRWDGSENVVLRYAPGT